MALLFTVLLGLSASMLGYFIYYISHETDVGPHHGLQWLIFLSILLMGFVVFTSFLISTFVVNRTNRIALAAQDIMNTGDLSRRIAIDSRWDDLSNMAYVLNRFLDRLEELVNGIQHVSDNIAHDLRTPLTRLLNNLEDLRQRETLKNDAEAQAACEEMIREADMLLNTFNALLRISRIETGRQTTNFQVVDMKVLLEDVVDLYEALAEERDISISKDLEPAICDGDRDLLFQIFVNLLDNAVKYTPQAGAIMVSLKKRNQKIVVSVRDSGPGIPDSEKEKVFERFYRMERSRTTQGNGLGLSLVKVAAALHNAEIKLQDAYPGMQVNVIFPAI